VSVPSSPYLYCTAAITAADAKLRLVNVRFDKASSTHESPLDETDPLYIVAVMMVAHDALLKLCVNNGRTDA
jgi:hypothetical protein